MSASFPNAKKTFSAVVNGVTKLVAALFNSPDDEIEAIETFIGPTGGGAQAYSESLTNLLLNYIRGCKVEYKSAADIYVRLGEIMITDASGNRRLRRNTSDLTVNWTNIDTGAEEASTTYYVYAVADASATTFTVKISKSASAPSGCTFYKKIGSFYNDSSSNITSTGFINDSALLPISILDYGTSFSSSTERGTAGSLLKIAYGSTNGAVPGNSSQAITNLPFSGSETYRVAISSVTGALSAQPSVIRNSGAQFTWTNNHNDNVGGNGNGDWIAIGI